MKKTEHLSFYHRWYYPSIIAITQFFMALIVVFIFCETFPSQNKLFWSWDTDWYLRIVRHGYLVKDKVNAIQPTAFYPLYPILIKIVYSATHLSLKAISFAISNIAFWFALIYLYRYTFIEHGKQIAQYTIWLLIAFPSAMFFHCAYSESLNLLFLVLFFYFLQKNRWYEAMIAGMLAAATHGFGLILILSALSHLWIYRKSFDLKTFYLRLISVLIIPAGIFAYMIFLYLKTGSPFTFIYAHRFWNHKFSVPVWHSLHFLYLMYAKPWIHWTSQNIWNFKIVETIDGIFPLILVILGILMLTVYRKIFSLPIKLFYIVTLLLSISSGGGGRLDSFARYVVVLFPAFIIWAYLCRKKEYLFLASFCLMLPLNVILLGMFATGHWIT